jgi:glutamyl aminopeptidase
MQTTIYANIKSLFIDLKNLIYRNVINSVYYIDMAAIPDFVSGAMENWGIVTYRETRLLYDNSTNSIVDKDDVAITVCHELAHMWFGNLGKYYHMVSINYELIGTCHVSLSFSYLILVE